MHPQACDGTTMVWDYVEALEALRAAPDGTVAAVFTDLPRLDRAVVNRMRRDPWWVGLYEQYTNACGAEALHVPTMRDLEEQQTWQSLNSPQKVQYYSHIYIYIYIYI